MGKSSGRKNSSDNADGCDDQNNLAAHALKTDIVPASQYRDPLREYLLWQQR